MKAPASELNSRREKILCGHQNVREKKPNEKILSVLLRVKQWSNVIQILILNKVTEIFYFAANFFFRVSNNRSFANFSSAVCAQKESLLISLGLI